MVNLKLMEPPLPKLTEHIINAGTLVLGICLTSVGVGEVGKNALRLQAGQGAQGLDFLAGAFQRRFVIV